MTIPVGKMEYQLGVHPTTGCGLSYSDDELNTALAGKVQEVVFDIVGQKQIINILAETGFSKDDIEKNLVPFGMDPEDWRVGEGIAECYLSEHRQCFFPWPDSRDERKIGSSLPGADLVGFQVIGDEIYFAYGEVKTSSESKYPPGVMVGRSGLQSQIEDLKDNDETKCTLMNYLAFRSRGQDWENYFKRAAQKFLKCSKNIRIFGVLIRDVQPNERDIKNRINNLVKNQYSETYIELLALYLPSQSISQLSRKIMQYKNGGVI
ncbi:hypothetical protein [Volucribacter amazonae]|uniref:Uncharacterized protein n=1 Tax=Volucribacter amazonae TaxID=256731 RepID=A0A9X4PH72_9PAST|nr:hypothetical protein [Volucribacter amazonae]MDG6895135.1 hypothetical protein [Volucribacter amazonae]